MRRGAREKVPKNIEKVKTLYKLEQEGLITQDDILKIFGISFYLWKCWVSRYVLNDSEEQGGDEK